MAASTVHPATAKTVAAASKIFADGVPKKIALIAIAMCVLAYVRRKEARKRWLPKDVAEDDSKCYRVVDNPAFAYLLENGVCFGLGHLLQKYFPALDKNRPLHNLVVLFIKEWIIVNPMLLIQKIAIAYMYPHVKYFSAMKPPQDLGTILRDYLKCNLPVEICNAIIQTLVIMALPDSRKEEICNPPPLRLGRFIVKYIIARFVVDIVFGIAHRIMHENQWVYDNIHKTHHEHNTPRTQTNFHFTWIDLFLEAVFPLYAAVAFLELNDLGTTGHELVFMIIPLFYYEIASHSGKEAPIVTWIPFLAPLVDWFTGCDQRLIEYHTRHHQLYKCNYSISPWWDMMLGTYRMDLPDAYNKEGSYE